ncbi:unnamed protein product, partial [marine sediment metagenome]
RKTSAIPTRICPVSKYIKGNCAIRKNEAKKA